MAAIALIVATMSWIGWLFWISYVSQAAHGIPMTTTLPIELALLAIGVTATFIAHSVCKQDAD